MSWFRHDPGARRATIRLHVQPGARRSEFAGLHGDALKVRIAAPAVENRANAALVELLSEALGVPKSAVRIRSGGAARRKLVEVSGGAEVLARLERLGSAP
jgi:uncharacterized protein (TIGR00251 family)